MTPTDAVVAQILANEGGVADLGDGQGVTRYGQTAQWLAHWHLEPPTDAVSAAYNYTRWLELTHLGDVVNADAQVGFYVADWAVHGGEQVAIRGLQRLVGVVPDGIIGPVTLEAVQDAPRRKLACQIVAARARDLGKLLASQTVDRRKWASGWLNRLAAQIETLP